MHSLRTWLIVGLAATTVGGALLAWKQRGELAELRAATMSRDERAEMQKRVWDLEKTNRQLNERLATSPADATPGASASASRDGGLLPRGSRSGDPLQQLSNLRQIMSQPEVQALMAIQQKAAIDARYAALFKQLNLAPDQIERLKSMLAERQTTQQDIAAVALEKGLDPRRDRDAVQTLQANARSEINAGIKSVIGENGFAQMETYEKTLPQRNVVNQLQQRLSYTDTPLTSAQADQLVQVLAANQPSYVAVTSSNPNGGPLKVEYRLNSPGGSPTAASPRGPELDVIGTVLGGFIGTTGGIGNPGAVGTGPAITPAAVSQSQSVLSAPQVAALQQLQQQQQSQQQLAKIMADSIAAQNATARPGGSPPPLPPPKKPGG